MGTGFIGHFIERSRAAVKSADPSATCIKCLHGLSYSTDLLTGYRVAKKAREAIITFELFQECHILQSAYFSVEHSMRHREGDLKVNWILK